MKRILIGVALALMLGYAVLLGLRPPPPKPRAFTIVAQTITLPEDASTLPAGPHVEVVTTNCTSCHSASMMTNQPALKPEQWAATVKKMRDVYHAPISAADDAKLVAALVELQSPAR